MSKTRAVLGPQAVRTVRQVGVAVAYVVVAFRLGLIAAAPNTSIVQFWTAVAIATCLSAWAVSLLIRAFPRRDLTHIVFEDLSAGRDERLDRNRILAQSVISRLQNPQQTTFNLQMDVMPGANEPGFGGLQPVLTMASALKSERADRPIKIGAVEFSLGDVLTLISSLFARPPKQYLEGWLIEANGSVEVGARMLDHRRQPEFKGGLARTSDHEATPEPLAWLVRATGGRERAIADLAAQILVDTDRSTITNDWRSLRSFQEAMVLRDDQRFDAHQETSPTVDPKATVSSARGHLARAVSYDPSNWIARFSLAVTLCRDDEPLLALQHLDILEKAIARAWPNVLKLREERQAAKATSVFAGPELKPVVRQLEQTVGRARAYVRKLRQRTKTAEAPDDFEGPGFRELVRHLDMLPECAFLILFNEGIARATRKDDSRSLCQARHVFEQFSNWMPASRGCATSALPVVSFRQPYEAIAESMSDQRRTTLALYGIGAHASLIADTDGSSRGAPLESDPVAALQQLLRRIDENCRVQNADHWPSALSARAITQAALGHVYFKHRLDEGANLDKCLNDAQTNFEAALAAEPRLVRAMLGLSEIYLERADQERHPTRINEWLSRADALLDRSMTINAGCALGRLLRDRVHASRVFAGGAPSGSAVQPRAAGLVAAL